MTKIGLSWVITISPTALALKARPNCCGDKPNMPCRMNGAPEMYANSVANISPATSTMVTNIRSLSSRAYELQRSASRSPPGAGPSASVSGRATSASTQSPTAASASATKMPRHDVTVSSTLPRDGARMGATPSTRISRESN